MLVFVEHDASLGVNLFLQEPIVLRMDVRDCRLGSHPFPLASARDSQDFRHDLIEGQHAVGQAGITTAPGIPQTTPEASSCARTVAPCALRIVTPRNPSCPIPVRTAATTAPPYTSLIEVNSASTAGRQGVW